MGVAIYNSRNSKVGIDHLLQVEVMFHIYNSRNSKVGIDKYILK